MKKLTRKQLTFILLLCLPNIYGFSQVFNEINANGWGAGMINPKPFIIDIDNDSKLDMLVGLQDGTLNHYEQAEPGSDSLIFITKNFCGIDVEENAAPTIADFDNDGLLDLLVGGEENISYYKQDVSGSYNFSLVTANFMGLEAWYAVPVVCDLDNDGLLDILVSKDFGGVSLYEQTAPGSLTFNLVTNSLGLYAETESSFCVNDIDNNGRLDVLSGRGGEISHYEQVASGSLNFELIAYSYIATEDNWDYAPYITDFDADGILDLLIGCGSGHIIYYRQEVLPSYIFDLKSENLTGGEIPNSSAPCLIDLDTDGLKDLLVGTGQGNILLYEQTAPLGDEFVLMDGIFDYIDVGTSAFPECVDLDGDGLLDLLIGNSDGQIYHYVQDSETSYTFNLVTPTFNDISFEGRATPHITDLDRDGLYDLLVGSGYYEDEYLRFEQASVNSLVFEYLPGGVTGINSRYCYSVTINDIDNDGALDILASWYNNIRLYEESFPGSMDFLLKDENFNFIFFDNIKPYLCDLDNDEKFDLLAGSGDGEIYHYEQGADSLQFNFIKTNVTDEIDVGAVASPCIVDLDGDGLMEMICGSNSGLLDLYVQNPQNPLEFSLMIPNFCDIYQYPYDYSTPSIFDLDDNGLLDLFVGLSNRILRFEQSATDPFYFEQLSENFLSSGGLGDYAAPLFYDINNDGLLELLVGGEGGTLKYFQQDAPFSVYFSPVSVSFNNIDVGNNSAPVLCDINNNGLLDLLIGSSSGVIQHYEQTAFESLEFTLITQNFGQIYVNSNARPTAGDVNSDGYIDLVVGNNNGGLHLFVQEEQLALVPYSLNLTECDFPEWWTQEASGNMPFSWSTENTNLAGGNPCEIKASPYDETGTSRLKSPLLDVEGMDSFTLAFSHYYEDLDPGLTAKIEWSNDGITWNDAGWEISSGNGNIGPDTQQVEITNFGSNKIYLSFTLTGNHNQFAGWYVDDIWMFDQQAAPSKTNPVKPLHLNLAYNGTELLWDEVPNASGYELYFGTDNPPTNIENGLTLTDNVYFPENYLDFALTYFWKVVPYNGFGNAADCEIWEFTIKQLPPPRNLEADITVNDVQLEWEEPIAIEESQVWVADLDPNTSSGPTIFLTLEQLGIIAFYENELPQNPEDYNAIFVCLGVYDENHQLSMSEGQGLADYLNDGGNLYMEGGDTWVFDIQTAVHALFNITPEADGSDDLNTILGIENTPTAGMAFDYIGDNAWIDHISPNNGAYLLLKNDNPEYGVTVANSTTATYSTIGSSMEFGGLQDNTLPSTKLNLMLKYLDVFNIIGKGVDSSNEKTIQGYNVYRADDAGSVFAKINPELLTETEFEDNDLLIGNYYYQIKALYNEGISVPSNIDSAFVVVGINDNNKDEISVYPNPAHSVVEITSPEPIYQITGYNSNGDKVFDLIAEANSAVVKLENLKPGIYLIKLQLDNRTEVRKLIIQRE